MTTGVSAKVLRSEAFKRKRRNVVRDWLYFIIWYVRLKRILEQHKATSAGPSPAGIFNCKPQGAAEQTKSPVQDPTQMTTFNLAAAMP